MEEREGIVFDSDTIIDYLRGREEAARLLNGLPRRLRLTIVISAMEVLIGARNKEEAAHLKNFIERTFGGILLVTERAFRESPWIGGKVRLVSRNAYGRCFHRRCLLTKAFLERRL